MARENDLTQGMARPGVVVAAVRSGGTFLAHCLSNHPQVFCDRGEPLHHSSSWVRALGPDRQALLAAMWSQTGYHVSLFKLTYTQALHREIWPWLVSRRPLVLHLTRENLIRQAVSMMINRQARDGRLKRPQHSFEAVGPARVSLEPGAVLQQARGLQAIDRRAAKMLATAGLKTLSLSYVQLVGGEGETAEWMPPRTTTKVCQFLDVRRERMRCDLQRVNAYPLRALVQNWAALEKAVRDSEFAGCLDDELGWADV